MLRIGDRKGFEKFRDRNIATFKELGVETIITSCAGCTSTFKEEYADLLPGIEILHSTEYLERLISQGKLPIKNKVDLEVTYHDPCHIGRYCGIYDPPRNILKSIPGLKLTEMERIREDSYCCGEGGGVRTAFPEVASWVATERLEEARITTGSNVLVSACPFCEHNFKQVSGEKGFKIVDVNELVLQAL
jgi:Fe-S oxidoreductase